ncbi:MAG: crossover junction endodeoxyribonuclease RuvC [Candidatus Vogelbacteria bacterium]|nr:crossover junction endodeoxyribonuclease RuvC [Candidatus Vogelbacteria bacterium]
MGIDPGYDRLGVAIVQKGITNQEELIFSDCLTSDRKDIFPERLKKIGLGIESLINKFNPDYLVLEKLFVTNNQKTAMMVGEIRGMIMYIGAKASLPLLEYTPLEIKSTITGYGKADKEQVILMVKNLIKINREITHDDEFDAIAIALTAIAREVNL